VTLKQGPGITPTAEALARDANSDQGACAGKPIPACFGNGGAASATASAAAYRQRWVRHVGTTIRQRSAAKHVIRGTSRNDEIRATHAVRMVRAGAGHDQVLTGRGANKIDGGSGSDELTSFQGNDRLKGGTGHDLLQGGAGNDVSMGNSGSDSLFDARGRDRMFAGPGADRIVVRDKHGGDRVDCGSGRDMVIADPSDRIVVRRAGKVSTVRAGAFTAHHTPAGSTCEFVYSSVHMPPRNPPHIGHRAGRPRWAPEPRWPVFDSGSSSHSRRR